MLVISDIMLVISDIMLVISDKARIRVQLSASHTPQDIDTAVDAFIEIGRKLKVIQ